MGYRKALEFLVKDYLIYKINNKGDFSQMNITYTEEDIKEKRLSDCIKLIIDRRINELAIRAAWLGNDETHYVRKWKSKDITDLKELIHIALHFILCDIKADNCIKEMENPKKQKRS